MQRLDEFAQELRVLGKQTEQNLSLKDYWHMRKVGWFGTLCFFTAIVTIVAEIYLASVLLFAFSLMIDWLLMHHIGHGGYNKIKSIPRRFHSKYYAQGWRRFIDWFDWIKPSAWNHEHNYLHHSFTGESKDPDLVERNLDWLANSTVPRAIKWLVLLVFALTWKVTYYSARTLSFYKGNKPIHFGNFFDLRHRAQRTLWLELFLPYALFHFVFLPILFEYLLGIGQAYLWCRFVAEILHNLHTFIIIVPNHAGDDLHRFENVDRKQRGGTGFYLRQILGSVNYRTGNEWLDLPQMYLNYQIEHHLFPALPMRQYRIIQPKVRAICAKYQVPYLQDSLWRRLAKMIDIATGDTKMLVEDLANKARCEDEATSTYSTSSTG